MYDPSEHRPDPDGRCIKCAKFHLCRSCQEVVHEGTCNQIVHFWTKPDGTATSRTVRKGRAGPNQPVRTI